LLKTICRKQMESYQQLADCLHARGIESFLQHPELLVISNQNPAMPDSNSFWFTKKDDVWFIGTWLPAIYQVADEKQICDICEAVFKSSPTAIYSVAPDLAAKLNLRRLTDSEMAECGF
jgi:hypothetical protein